jgi:hypothetical protein
MMCHGYRNQSMHFRAETLRGNLSVYKGANVNFPVFEFPLMLFYKQMVRSNNCTRL